MTAPKVFDAWCVTCSAFRRGTVNVAAKEIGVQLPLLCRSREACVEKSQAALVLVAAGEQRRFNAAEAKRERKRQKRMAP